MAFVRRKDLMPDALSLKLVSKTASLTWDSSLNGVVIDNQGATGAIVLTLPAVANVIAGSWVALYCTGAPQTVTFTAQAGELETTTNTTGTSIGCATLGAFGFVVADVVGGNWRFTSLAGSWS